MTNLSKRVLHPDSGFVSVVVSLVGRFMMLFSKKKVLIKKSELWSILKIHFSYGCSVKFYDNVYVGNDKDVENVDTT